MNKKSIKLLSLFSGIGSPEQALKNIGVDYELVGFSEVNKFAIKSYCKVHDVSEDLSLGDITKIDISSLPTDIDLITHGSPCQDFSIAGQQKGGDKGTGTRSSLMWNTVDIVEHSKPKVVLWENVKNLLSKNHRHNFDGYLEVMEQLGYNNYYQVLNAKDYGIPQNRERVFTVSIRKDIDKGYVFPEPQELTLRLKDILEDEVDEKYYINKAWKYSTKDKHDVNEIAQIEGINYKAIRSITDVNKVCRCLDTMGGGQREPKILEPVKNENKINVLGNYMPSNHTASRVVDVNGICPTVMENHGTVTAVAVPKDNYVLEPLITETTNGYKVRVANKQGYQIAFEGDGIDLEQPNSKTRRGRVQKQSVGTLNTSNNKAVVDNYRVRKLTPRECWRLMGFTDDQFDKAAEACSNTQLYKQAGNSIVVNVLEEIFKNVSVIN